MRICHASISENKSVDGKRGDQTAKEVCIREWYSKPWMWMLRYPDTVTADKIASVAEKLANSNLVGYSQPDRNFLYEMLKNNDFVVEKYISSGILTNTDCSAFVTACAVCAGIKELQYNSNAPTTSTMVTKFAKSGFIAYSDPAHITNPNHLKRGDILVKPSSHTVIVLDNSINEENAISDEYYPKYTGNSRSIYDALLAVGEKDASFTHRKRIAMANGFPNGSYIGEPQQNNELLRKLKAGTLRKA